jgi:hypothetical protein
MDFKFFPTSWPGNFFLFTADKILPGYQGEVRMIIHENFLFFSN